jgi:hypothetical protein
VIGVAGATTAAQYRRQAETICEATTMKLQKVPKPQAKNEIVAFLRIGLGYFTQQHAKLQKLKPPKVYRYLHGKVLALDQTELETLKAMIDRIDRGADAEKAYDAVSTKLNNLAKAQTTAWKKLRVKACWLQ